MSKNDLLSRGRTCLLVVDVQERLLPVIHENEMVARNIERLIRGAEILGVPVIVSEQYPKGLGPTVEPLRKLVEGAAVAEKLTFSCLRDPGLAERLRQTGRDTLLVCGIESHVCVLQTSLDALREGYKVQVAADAVSSRSPANKQVALERLAGAGAVITCTESALFELLEKAGSEEFRQISRLVK